MEEVLAALGPERVLHCDVAAAAAESGNVPLLAWLLGHGYELDEELFLAAVRGGCETTLEWLAVRGCKMETRGTGYVTCAWRGDLLIMYCLRRLGYPFGPDTFSEACRHAPLAPLRWMVGQGVPMDSLARAEDNARRGFKADVVKWLAALPGDQSIHKFSPPTSAEGNGVHSSG